MRHKNAGEMVTMTTPDIVPSIEFCLHHGTSFGRRLLVLPPGSNCAETLKARLDTIIVTDGSRSSEQSGVLSGSWLVPIDVDAIDSTSVACRGNDNCSEVEMEVETSRQEAPSGVESRRRSTPLQQEAPSDVESKRRSTPMQQEAPSDGESKRRSTPLRKVVPSEAVSQHSSTLADSRCTLRTVTGRGLQCR